MECASASKDVDNIKDSSPVKKSNGLDCNGIEDHQPDCDNVSKGVKSLPSNCSDPVHEEATPKVNGFSNSPDRNTTEKPIEKTAAADTLSDVPSVGKGPSESTMEGEAEISKEDEHLENEDDAQNQGQEQLEVGDENAEKAAAEVKLDPELNDAQMEIDRKEEQSKKPVLLKDEESKSCAQNSNEIVKNDQDLSDNADKSLNNNGASDKLSASSSKSASEVITDSKEIVEKAGKEELDEAPKSKRSSEVAASKPSESKSVNRSESTGDDIEIIGESFTQTPPSQSAIYINSGLQHKQAIPGMPFQAGFSANGSSNVLADANVQNALLLQTMRMPGAQANLMSPGHGQYVFSRGFPNPPGVSLLNANAQAPPTPKSSMDQIELIRWEIQNRINVRPKYFKPNPTSELGPLAKFLFDIGSDLIKESVYHDLVKIQSKKNEDDKLSEKERDDLAKLKEIEKDLQATIGHLKLRFKKRCQGCGFQTESNNVLFFHKQFPHEDNKNLRCTQCHFSTKQSMAFKFHMEAEHAMQGRLHEKKAFFECHMCPYENNQEQKLVAHRERCLKQFRPLFNLHPSCLSGAEINLCLENIFYKPLVPKNLKLLQQKHAQQQAALAEAKRQQAQMQMIAAQKNAAALAAKKQQQQLQQQQLQLQKQRQLPNIAPRFNSNMNPRAQSLLGRQNIPQHQPAVRYNAKAARPTVANMLNKANAGSVPVQNSTPGGFEVCEICGGYVKDRKALRIHFFYAHRIDLPFNLFERNQAPLYCATCYVRFWTAQGLRKHIDTHKEENQTRGVVGKCISCGHHVLNLLLHMRIVHNRELQHYINALMCMFCGGHFSSRQDCERHIIKTHGNVDPVSGTLKSPPLASQITGAQGTPPNSTKSGSGSKKSSSGRGGGSNSLVKGSVCVLCNLNFGRNVDLTRHCMRMHHTCMKCGMVVIDKASLLKHTCLTSPSGTRDCGMCGESGFHPAYYVKHLRDKHLRKFSIKVAKVNREVVERWTKRPYPFENDNLVEISDSDDDSPSTGSKSPRRGTVVSRTSVKKPKIGPACSKIKKPVKKPRIGPASKIGRRPLAAEDELHDQTQGKRPETNHVEQKIMGDETDSRSRKNDTEKDKSVENENGETLAVEESSKEKDGHQSDTKSQGSEIVEYLSDKEVSPVKSLKRKSLDNESSGSKEKRRKSDTKSA